MPIEQIPKWIKSLDAQDWWDGLQKLLEHAEVCRDELGGTATLWWQERGYSCTLWYDDKKVGKWSRPEVSDTDNRSQFAEIKRTIQGRLERLVRGEEPKIGFVPPSTR